MAPLLGLISVLLVLVSSSAPRVQAATSSTLNFQARLLSNTGAVVADGDYNLEFKIYDTIASGTSAQGVCSLDSSTDDCWWLETRTGANKVRVVNGYFNVNLGSVTAFGANIPWDQTLYLTMNIGGTGTPGWDGEMLSSGNRMQLTGVPYAFRAGTLAKFNGTQTGTLSFNTVANSPAITLPDATGTVCLQSASACGFESTSGTDFIRNQINTVQTANFNIQSAANGSIGAIIKGASGQSVDLFELINGASGNIVFSVASAGATLFKNSTDGTTAFRIQNANGNNYLLVNTSGASISLGDTGIASTVQIGNTTGAVAQTINIGNNATASSTNTVVIGNLLGTSSTTIQGGTGAGAITLTQGSGGSIIIGGTGGSSAVSVQCGTGACGFGNNATDHSTILGSTTGTSATTLQSGSGGISLSGNTTVTSNNSFSALGAALFKDATNSTTAFQVQNSIGSAALLVDTTALNSNLTNSNFEATDVSAWTAKGTASAPTRDTSTTAYLGAASLTVNAGTAASNGIQYSTSLANNTYTLSFSIRQISGTAFGTNFAAGYSSGITDNNCTLSPTLAAQPISTTSWSRYSCTFASTSMSTLFWKQTDTPGSARTFNIDAVQIEASSSANPYKETGISLNGVINSAAVFQNAANSTTAFQIQNAAGTSNLFIADTTNTRVGIGKLTPGYTLDVNGDINIASGSVFRVNGTQISSANLSNDSDLAKLDGTGPQTFTGNNKFTGTFLAQNASDGTTAFRIQNSSGNNYLLVNTSGASVSLGDTGIAGTVQIGNTTGAVAQTINIGNNATGSSTNTVVIGNLLGTSSTTIQGGTGASAIALTQGSGGTITIGGTGGASAVSVQCGTGTCGFGNNATDHSTTLGSTTGTSVTTLQGGTGGINIGTGGIANTIQIGTTTGAVAQTVNIGNNATASSTNTVVIGNLLGTSTTTIQGGTGASAIALTQGSGGTITIGGTGGASAVSVQCGTGTCGFGNNATDHSTTLGSTTGTSVTTLQGGTGGINIGNNAVANTIQIGNTTGAVTQTINIGNNATASSVTNVTMGSTIGTSTTTIQSGSGGISLSGNTTVATNKTFSALGDSLFKDATNSTTAFQVQNAIGSSVIVADTTALNSNLTNSNFEGTDVSAWTAKNTASAPTRDTSTAAYLGSASLTVSAGTGANNGIQYVTSPANATYTLSFSIRQISGTAFGTNFAVGYGSSSGDNNCTLTPTLSNQAIPTTGWARFSCTMTTSGATGFYWKQTDTPGSARTFNIDAVQLESGSTATAYKETGISLNGVINSAVVFQNASNSTTAFQIQNAAGTASLLIADTLNTKLKVGSNGSVTFEVGDSTSGNYASFDSTNHELTLNGNSRHTRRIKLVPEYAGATLTGDGSSNTGTMVSDNMTSSPYRNYYEWTTTQGSAQDYDIWVRLPVPSDYSALPTSQTICMDVYASATTANTIALTLYGTDSSSVSLTDGDLTPSSTNTWQEQCTSSITGGTYAANGTITLDFKLNAPATTGLVRISALYFDYLSKW